MDSGGGLGIKAAQQAPQGSGMAARSQALAQGLVTLGCGDQSVEHGAEVESGAAADNGQAAASGDIARGGAGQASVFAGGEKGIRSDQVDEVVRNAGAIRGRGFGGADLEFTIDGNRIATNDFSAEAQGKVEGKRGLSAGGRAGNDQ
jgi:hypothetical protein